MRVADDVAGPRVEVPRGVDIEVVPARADEGRGSVPVVAQLQLPLLKREVVQDLRILCLFGDGKDHASIGDPVDNALVELDVAGEEASSSGAEGMSRGHRLDGGGQPAVVGPV